MANSSSNTVSRRRVRAHYQTSLRHPLAQCQPGQRPRHSETRSHLLHALDDPPFSLEKSSLHQIEVAERRLLSSSLRLERRLPKNAREKALDRGIEPRSRQLTHHCVGHFQTLSRTRLCRGVSARIVEKTAAIRKGGVRCLRAGHVLWSTINAPTTQQQRLLLDHVARMNTRTRPAAGGDFAVRRRRIPERQVRLERRSWLHIIDSGCRTTSSKN